MRFEGITFFVDDKDLASGPVVSLTYSRENCGWPILINIGTKSNAHEISAYLKSELQLIQFVNSIGSSYNSYRKEMGYDR